MFTATRSNCFSKPATWSSLKVLFSICRQYGHHGALNSISTGRFSVRAFCKVLVTSLPQPGASAARVTKANKTIIPMQIIRFISLLCGQIRGGAGRLAAVLNARPKMVPIKRTAELAEVAFFTVTCTQRAKFKRHRQMVLPLFNMHAARSVAAFAADV